MCFKSNVTVGVNTFANDDGHRHNGQLTRSLMDGHPIRGKCCGRVSHYGDSVPGLAARGYGRGAQALDLMSKPHAY
ncbi:hypothetical protein GCM10025779_04490 [Arthrobacter cryoconiti]